MEKRILFINPIASSDYDDQIQESLEVGKSQDMRIKVVSLEKGPLHLDYHYYETLALAPILHLVKQTEREGYDAAIIGCFYNSGLEAAREITHKLVVAAPAESCLHIAASLGHSFSIIVVRKKCIPKIREKVVKYGFREGKLSHSKPSHNERGD
jgi:allantoin racemase